jgi:hypothetical protein
MAWLAPFLVGLVAGAVLATVLWCVLSAASSVVDVMEGQAGGRAKED